MSKLGRVATLLPAVGAVMAATALTGAAVFTVGQAGCADAGSYVQHAQYTELVGGCLDSGDLPAGVHPVPRHATGDGQLTRQ